MPDTTCSRCGGFYDAGSEKGATDYPRACPNCLARGEVCPKGALRNWTHRWVPFIERIPSFLRGLECGDCGHRPA